MKLIVDVTPDEDDQIRTLIGQGRYRTQEQFLQVSIRNQLRMESDGLALPPNVASPAAVVRTSGKRESLPGVLARPDQIPKFKLLAAQTNDAEVLPYFVTKLWPVKLIVRFLANESVRTEHPSFRDTDILGPLQSSAVEMRGFLQRLQKDTPRTRGTYLHAGLPDGDSKSLKRFHELYFTGRPGPANASLAARLGLVHVNRNDADEITVGLTPRGLEFALMENPLLDGQATDADVSPFSDEEAFFLGEQLRLSSKPEAQLMTQLAQWLDLQPKSRDDTKQHLLPTIKANGGKSEAIQDGMFVAITSRMVELDCAKIVKDGPRTLYVAGPRVSTLWRVAA